MKRKKQDRLQVHTVWTLLGKSEAFDLFNLYKTKADAERAKLRGDVVTDVCVTYTHPKP